MKPHYAKVFLIALLSDSGSQICLCFSLLQHPFFAISKFLLSPHLHSLRAQQILAKVRPTLLPARLQMCSKLIQPCWAVPLGPHLANTLVGSRLCVLLRFSLQYRTLCFLDDS